MTDKLGVNMDRVIRLLLAALGGYAFTAGYIGLVGAVLSWLGLHRAEAITLAFVSGLIVYVGLIIWVAATTALLRTSMIIIAASAVMIGTAPLIAGDLITKGITP